jgi:ethanolaminephosphotransferase
MKLDTFLHQMNRRKQKIVFAGDDTWLMFPFFHRAYANKDSLFVNDFNDGDNNITTNLAYELKRNDWKLLICHYLGLDHIGHVFNPFHELVPKKLNEMDNVVKMIHSKLVEWNSKSKEKSVLFLTADHGMRDAGGHSGNSYSETHIPLIMIGEKCNSNNETIYNQIDFATTFSIINDLHIPESSIGSLITEMLFNFNDKKKLETFRIINHRLMDMIKYDKSEGL